jgi:hypothetical protein
MAALQEAMKRELITLTVFALVFATLCVSSYRQKSATYDEPKHLTIGYAALGLRDYRLDHESPPLLRMWAAFPLVFMRNVTFDTNSAHWLKGDNTEFCHEFLYKQNDADRLLYPARFMIVLLGIALGVVLFAWARELFGCGVAAVVLALYTLEPNILAHASVVTTDLGFTFLFCSTLYFLWRITRALNAVNLVGLAVFFALAQVSKFPALALMPIAIVLLAIHGVRKRCLIKMLFVLVCMLITAYTAIWTVYGFCHAADIDGYFLPRAYVQGIPLGLIPSTHHWPAFLAGKISEHGWWYYYPVAFIIKTPIAILALFFGGLVVCGMCREKFLENEVFLLLPLAMFFTSVSLVKLDTGLRYILPVYPLVLLIAGKFVATMVNDRRRLLLGAALTLAGIELATVYPHTLAFFNFLVGGPRGGSRILVDSNLDWGQDLKLLKHWMNDHDIRHINLCYFGTADPAYYGINCAMLPGSPVAAFDAPQLPGYVAISVTNLRGVYLPERGRMFYEPLNRVEPVATVGHSIFIYYLERPWW